MTLTQAKECKTLLDEMAAVLGDFCDHYRDGEAGVEDAMKDGLDAVLFESRVVYERYLSLSADIADTE